MLKVNDPIPQNITISNMSGDKVTLSDYLGQYIILYFYPKDDTESCTKEACSFRDYNKDLEKLGIKVIGVSKDTVKSHKKFTDKFSLNFELLSDPNHILQDAFGVWGEKLMFGKQVMGTLRTTFAIDPEGKIIHVWEGVKSEGHGKEVYEWMRQKIG